MPKRQYHSENGNYHADVYIVSGEIYDVTIIIIIVRVPNHIYYELLIIVVLLCNLGQALASPTIGGQQ